MDQPKDKTELTILIDPKHKTEYCITPSGCYIKKSHEIAQKGTKSEV